MMKKKTEIFSLNSLTQKDKQYIADALTNGKTAIMPTDTVYGLTVFAKRDFLHFLNAVKNNPNDKPAQILCSKEYTKILAQSSPAFNAALKFWPGALTAILKASAQGKVLSGLESVGLRVPASNFLEEIFNLSHGALFASSANMHNLPTLEKQSDILAAFDGKADIIVINGDLKNKPSAVIDFTVYPPKIIRQGTLNAKDLQIFKTLTA